MSIEKITDYSEFNKPVWLIEYFRESNLVDILESYDNQFDDLEQSAFEFFTDIWLDYAIGEQLDVLGVHVDIDRNGLDDESYRTLLKAKIEINVSSGEPERLISAGRSLFNTEDIEYTPEYPAKVRMLADGDLIFTKNDNFVDSSSNNFVDSNGNNLTLNSVDESFYTVLLGVVPSGVGLLIADYLIDHDNNFIITHEDDRILVRRFAEDF